ncbi:MAG TPA: DNA polymerase III subunit delta' [Anaerolineales bacterium]|nr:DNA polymerase III subunit delta' [Anaerolineales bacterium]
MDENWGLTGHEWAVTLLRQHVASGSARHAYLITGPRGVGRRTLGLRFAQALNCTSPISPGEPCGVCDDCRRILDLKHPDLTTIEAENEGGTLKVEQVRELRRIIVLRPFQASHRVAMLLRFQEAHDAAANALLKTLEEAPSYAVLILTAESSEGLLPTIVSRCEVLRLHPVPANRIQRLLEQRGADSERARLLAHISDGRPGAALDLLADPDALTFRDERLNDLRGLLTSSRAQKFAYADRLSGNKAAMRQVLMIWLSFWRDVLWRVGGAKTDIANVDRQADVETLAGKLDLARARQLVADHDRALRRLDANVNARLLAEVLLLDWPR